MTIVSKAKAALVATAVATVMAGVAPAAVQAQPAGAKKPNILIIWGDDIGQFNVSAYNMGMMGYKTPNIDSIAKQGALFTDWYGQQSCTAGRAAFITGQSPIRTGLTKVGLPGAPEGLQKEDPTHRGPAQGARLRHRPVREEPPRRSQQVHSHGSRLRRVLRQPLPPERRAGAGDRGLSEETRSSRRRSVREGSTTASPATRTTRPWTRASARSASRSARTPGPLNLKRMETIDEEITKGALGFMDKAHKDGKPFFVWWNSTRMHVFTHLKPASVGKTGLGIYADGMAEHDGMVGELLAKLKELGIEDNTIVMYSTDNGAGVLHLARRRHHDVPRREEHAMGRRLPCAHGHPLARRHQARHHHQRHRRARGHDADAAGRGWRHHRQGRPAQGQADMAPRPSRSTSTATT